MDDLHSSHTPNALMHFLGSCASLYLRRRKIWEYLPTLREISPDTLPQRLFELLRRWNPLFPRRVLDCFRMFHGRTPLIEPPPKNLSFRARCIWTLTILFICLVMEQIPIYGIVKRTDYLVSVRSFYYGAHGTLTEMGNAGIGFGALMTLVCDYYEWLDSNDTKKNDWQLAETARAVIPILGTLWLAVLFTIFEPCFEFLPGHYIPAILLVQVFGSGLIIFYFDQILSKGYGVCGLMSLFVVVHQCKRFFWDAFSPVTIDMGRGPEFEGAILNLVHLLWSWEDKAFALYEAFFRKSQPNLLMLVLTVIIFFLIISLKGVRVEIPLRSRKTIGERGTIPIPLLITCMDPLHWNYHAIHTLTGLTMFRQIFIPTTWRILLKWGTWDSGGEYLPMTPSGGLVYWFVPPYMFPTCLNPYRTWIYGIYIIGSCVISARCTITQDDHEYNPDKMVEDLLGPTGVTMAGKPDEKADDALRQELCRILPVATILGGLIVGSICVFCDVLNILGGGHAMLIGTSVVWSIYEMRKDEKKRIEQEFDD